MSTAVRCLWTELLALVIYSENTNILHTENEIRDYSAQFACYYNKLQSGLVPERVDDVASRPQAEGIRCDMVQVSHGK